ncbi:MAG: YihY/virulence factor BrkB family protein [Anditalea sp.]
MINRLVKRVDKRAIKLRNIYFGNPDQNVYDVGRVFIAQVQKDELTERASAVAFNFTVAMFPLLLFLLNTIPYVGWFFPEVTAENILLFVREILPESLYEGSEATIMDIVSRPRQGMMSFGFFLALFLATSGVVSMMAAFNSCHRTKENRSFLKTRAIAVGIIVVLVLSLCSAVVIMIFGNKFLNVLSEYGIISNRFIYYTVAFSRFFTLLILFVVTTSFIFRYAPAVHDKWRFFSLGSITAGLLISLAFFLFSYYLNNFASYNKLYGSIGTMIAVMLWLLITSYLILIGFEINVSMDKAAERKPVTKFIGRSIRDLK